MNRAKRPVLPRLLAVLAWAMLFAVCSNTVAYLSKTALQHPYIQPKRTPVLQAWNELGARNSDVLFVGDSRTGFAFIPAVVDVEARRAGVGIVSFNISGPRSTVPGDAGVINYVLSEGARPRLIIWGMGKREASRLDFAAFQRTQATPGLAVDLFNQAPSWSNFCTLGFALTSGMRTLLEMPLMRLPAYHRELEAARRIRGWGWADDVDKWSHAYNQSRWPNAPSTPAEWAKLWAGMRKDPDITTPFREDTSITAAMRIAINEARRSGSLLIVVNMPTSQTRADIEKASGYDAYLSWLHGVCRDAAVPLVDLNRPPRPPFADFTDSQHLKAPAAERLSRRFTREFIVPALKASHQGGES